MMKMAAPIVLATLSAQASAQTVDDWRSWPMGDAYTISVDAFFPKIDTSVRLDASDGSIGTIIDFEQNLNMSDSEALPGLGFAWRFAKKHQMKLEVFNLNRSGSAISTSEIRFGDDVFQINLPISSFFDTRVTSLGYSYSLIFDERKELALNAGLSVQDVKFGLIGNGGTGIIQSESGLTAPLPAFGLNGGYAITDKWVARAGLGVFAFKLSLSDEDELSGEVVTAAALIQHQTFENVHFALSYSYFDVNADFKTLSRVNSLSYQYRGPMLTVSAAF
jgi:hypothetical protein